MKKLDFSKIRFNTKKDWVIFWIFAALVLYIAAYQFDVRIAYWLRSMGSPWLGYGNEPQSYGRMMITVAALAVLAEMVCFVRRRELRTKLTILSVGILAPIALVGMYQLHCRLIVSSLWKEAPARTLIWWKEPDGSVLQFSTPTEEEADKLLEYCRNLTIVSDKETNDAFMQWHREDSGNFWSGDTLNLRFTEKYGHSYSLELCAWEDYFYFFRGYDYKNDILVTLFEDNGLKGYLDDLKREHAK